MSGWYRVRITYGPGHQGVHVEWIWAPEKPSEDEMKEWFDEIANRGYMDWPIGKVEKMDLPEDVRQEKIKQYLGRIKGATAMLKVLGETP